MEAAGPRQMYVHYQQVGEIHTAVILGDAGATRNPARALANARHTYGAEADEAWELMQAEENAGMILTESFAMLPTASVSGLYFSHPEARYFGTGKLGRDQVEDYARRKGMKTAEAERWLASVLGYE